MSFKGSAEAIELDKRVSEKYGKYFDKMQELLLEERETHINWGPKDTYATVYSDDWRTCRRILKAGYAPSLITEWGAMTFAIPFQKAVYGLIRGTQRTVIS